jgi:hypothetical protein
VEIDGVNAILRRGEMKSDDRCYFLRTVKSVIPVVIILLLVIARLGFAQRNATIPIPPLYPPSVLKGLDIDPADPFTFKFILETGPGNVDPAALTPDVERLIKYFLAALAFPDDDLWVNLAPGEENRVIPQLFGRTAMGRDMLEQDLELKRLTARLLDPASSVGREFWSRIEDRHDPAGFTADQHQDVLSRVWVVPGSVRIFQNDTGAFVLDSRLRVVSRDEHAGIYDEPNHDRSDSLFGAVFAEVILPAVEEEVNSAESFSRLRQIYYSYILANWYKRRLRAMPLGHPMRDGYLEAKRTGGIDATETSSPEEVYAAYLNAFREGVSRRIIERYEPTEQSMVIRQYVTGGIKLNDPTETEQDWLSLPSNPDRALMAVTGRFQTDADAAMTAAHSSGSRPLTYAEETLLKSLGILADPAQPGARQALTIIAGGRVQQKEWDDRQDFLISAPYFQGEGEVPVAALIRDGWAHAWNVVRLFNPQQERISPPNPDDVLIQIGGSTDLMAEHQEGIFHAHWNRTRNVDINIFLSEQWIRESGIQRDQLGLLRDAFREIINRQLDGGLISNPLVVGAETLLLPNVTLYHPQNVYFGGARVRQWLGRRIKIQDNSGLGIHYADRLLQRYRALFEQAWDLRERDPVKSAKRLLALSRLANDDHARENLFRLILERGEGVRTRDLRRYFLVLSCLGRKSWA